MRFNAISARLEFIFGYAILSNSKLSKEKA